MDKKCVKCETVLTKSVANIGGVGKFTANKAPITDIKNRLTENELHPYVCSNCGYIEWYVDKPENFK